MLNLKFAAGDLLHFIFRAGYVVKVLGEGRFALSSNSVCMEVCIDPNLEFLRRAQNIL